MRAHELSIKLMAHASDTERSMDCRCEIMKYYIYISDAKLDMLYPQVPHAVKKKVSTDFKVDLKLIGGSRKSEQETEENRMTKLETVVQFLQEYGDVGTTDTPGSYFADTLDMQWGVPHERNAALGKSVPSGLVYFGAMANRISVGLFGSALHLVGTGGTPQPADMKTTIGGESLYFNIVEAINKIFDDEHEGIRKADIATHEEVLQQFALFAQKMKGPQQRLEFVAKRLAFGNAKDGCRVLIGTPLYVALAD
jgi:hypothetical protein